METREIKTFETENFNLLVSSDVHLYLDDPTPNVTSVNFLREKGTARQKLDFSTTPPSNSASSNVIGSMSAYISRPTSCPIPGQIDCVTSHVLRPATTVCPSSDVEPGVVTPGPKTVVILAPPETGAGADSDLKNLDWLVQSGGATEDEQVHKSDMKKSPEYCRKKTDDELQRVLNQSQYGISEKTASNNNINGQQVQTWVSPSTTSTTTTASLPACTYLSFPPCMGQLTRRHDDLQNHRFVQDDVGVSYERPGLTYPKMIEQALREHGAMEVDQIYHYIISKWPFFKNASCGWKNSIRHNLSLKSQFRKGQKINSKSNLWELVADDELVELEKLARARRIEERMKRDRTSNKSSVKRPCKIARAVHPSLHGNASSNAYCQPRPKMKVTQENLQSYSCSSEPHAICIPTQTDIVGQKHGRGYTRVNGVIVNTHPSTHQQGTTTMTATGGQTADRISRRYGVGEMRIMEAQDVQNSKLPDFGDTSPEDIGVPLTVGAPSAASTILTRSYDLSAPICATPNYPTASQFYQPHVPINIYNSLPQPAMLYHTPYPTVITQAQSKSPPTEEKDPYCDNVDPFYALSPLAYQSPKRIDFEPGLVSPARAKGHDLANLGPSANIYNCTPFVYNTNATIRFDYPAVLPYTSSRGCYSGPYPYNYMQTPTGYHAYPHTGSYINPVAPGDSAMHDSLLCDTSWP